MSATVLIQGTDYRVDLSRPIDISIPLRFNGPQPNAYGVAPATSIPCAAGELVGDTRQGGSCNFEQYTFIPHCNGTHTECVGHITHERISVRDCLTDVMIPAMLISVDPSAASETNESYSTPMHSNDPVMTRIAIERALFQSRVAQQESEPGAVATGVVSALIVRSLPNDEAKLTRQYLNDIPPYFTTEAMQYIVESSFEHLLVDLPSIDRLYDEGKLSNHRVFWNVEQGSFEINGSSRLSSTITEFIYVPNDVEDGRYLLNLQIAPLAADASPSRPILFRLSEI